MNHDFAKKKKKPQAKRRPAPKSQVPGWVWFFTGIVTAVFIYFLAYLTDITPTAKPDTDKPVAATKKQTPATSNEPETETKFDFYTLLPEREVIVPEPRPSSEADSEPLYQYILQAGSFRNAEDADRLRAKLLLLGMEAKVEAVKSDNGDVWHRVLAGPYTSRSKMSKARNTLANERIDTLLLKRKISENT